MYSTTSPSTVSCRPLASAFMSHPRGIVKGAAALALVLVLAGVVQAAVWDAATAWTAEDYTNPLAGTPWAFMVSTFDSVGNLIAAPDNIWATDKRGWTDRCFQGHGWDETYWSPRFIRNFGVTDVVYSERLWTYESDWSTTVLVDAPVGKIVVGGNASFIAENSAAMRWTAPADGSYQVTLAFTGTTTDGTSANVALSLDGADQWTSTVSAYLQAKSYMGIFDLTAGQILDAVVTGRDFVVMDFSITDEFDVVVPEPASGALLALAGLAILRRRRG